MFISLEEETRSLTTFQDLPYNENMSEYGAEI